MAMYLGSNKVEIGASSGGGGSSELSTAEVTIIANAGTGDVALTGGISGGTEGYGFLHNESIKTTVGVPAGSTGVFQAILVNGLAAYEYVNGVNVSTTGDITFDSDEGVVVVTGNGTITANPTA